MQRLTLIFLLLGTSGLWAQLNGTYTIGATGNYASVSAAMNALNTQGISGPVRFEILSNYGGEPGGTATINVAQFGPYPGMGTYSVTLTVHSSVTTPITVATAPSTGILGRFVFRLNGVDNFIIDGGPQRLLRFQNNAPSSGTGVIGLVSDNNLHNNPCRNITIRNVELDGGDKSQTRVGIYLGQVNTFPGAALVSGNNNILIEGCWIYGVQEGIILWGPSSTRDQNNRILRCKVGHPVLALSWGGAVRSSGITVANQQDLRVEGDTVFNASSPTSYAYTGISVGNTPQSTASAVCVNTHIAGNRIYTIQYTGSGGWDVYGLRINVGSVTDANIYVYNNFVADIIGDGYSSPAGTWNTYGIFLTGSTNANAGVYIYHNSVHLFGVPTTNSPPLNSNPACLAISSSITGGVRVRNNIFQNTQTPAGTSAPGRTTLAISYGGTNAAVFAELDNNVYYVANNNGASSAFIGSIGSTRYATLNDWRTAVGGGREQNSLVLTAPGAPFVSNTNLHIPDGTVTPIEGAGVLITSPIAILGDIYGNARPEGSPNPDAGAVEFVQSIPPCPSTIDADQISISPPSLLIGTGGNFTVSVNNPSNVTQPAQWELSIDGGPWAVYAPYQGTSLTYTPSAAGTYSFRLVARVARYHQACPGIQNDTSNIVTGVVTCPASLNADQITVSPTSIPAGQAVTVTVQNPSAVTLPAQWQVSTDGGATWSVVAPYAGSPFFYSPTVLQTHQIRLAALPPTGCSSLSIAYSNVESFNVLPPAGNTINDPINITPQVPTRLDTTVNGNSAIPGYTDAYTGSLLGSSFNRTTPDVFYMYILRECLDSIRVSTCLTQSPYHDTYLHVLNISAGRSLHTDGGICGSGSTLMQATIRAFHDPNTTGSTSLTSTASGGMRLAAGDTLIIIVEAWSASYVGPFVLQVQEYRFDPNSLPSLPQPPFFSFDTSRVCYLGSIVRDSLNTGINTPGLSHVWYLNGQAVSGVTGPIYRPQFNAPGIYQVVAEIRSSSLSFCAPTQSIPRDTVYIVVDSLPKVDFLVDGSLYEHAQFVTLSGTGTLCAQYQASLSNPNFTYVWRINGSTYVGQGPHQECYASSQSADTVVLITTNGACVEIDSLYVILDITTGVETGFSGVRVFPNPAKDRFYVSSSRGGEVELRLLDMQGRLLLDKRIELRGSGEPYAVPVSLPGGLYLIEIRQGNKLSRTRLFIE